MKNFDSFKQHGDVIWNIANVLRGPYRPPQYRRVMIPLNVHCFEFNLASLPDSLIDQLEASEAWCRALHSTIKHYTGHAKPIYLSKFVLFCHPNPAPYVDPVGKYLQRDRSIRHYLYPGIDGLSLDALDNTNVESVS